MEMRFTCRDDSLARVYSVSVAFRTLLLLRDSCVCPSQTPRAGHCKVRMRSPPCICLLKCSWTTLFLPEVHKFLCFSPLHALQPPGKHRGCSCTVLGDSALPEVGALQLKHVTLPASSLTSFMMFLPPSIPASRRKSSI